MVGFREFAAAGVGEGLDFLDAELDRASNGGLVDEDFLRVLHGLTSSVLGLAIASAGDWTSGSDLRSRFGLISTDIASPCPTDRPFKTEASSSFTMVYGPRELVASATCVCGPTRMAGSELGSSRRVS